MKRGSASQQLVVDCQNMDYNPSSGVLTAIGNVVVTFPEQQTILKADNLVYSENK
jgi:lipopolysaccharide export system protein LptA